MIKVYLYDDNYHVYKRNDEWIVRKATNERASKVFLNKNNAVKFAINLAKKLNSYVVIHSKNMKVEKII